MHHVIKKGMILMNKIATGLLSFIHTSTSPFHTVNTGTAMLAAAGFTELSPHMPWTITTGGTYYIRLYDSTLLAFTIGKSPLHNLRIAAAHTDSPCLRIKPLSHMITEDYLKLNVEVYGGLIRESWLDRPLSFAGKIVVKGKNIFQPTVQFIDYKTPFCIIPRLAIHLNRQTNDGVIQNPQLHLLPLYGLKITETESFLSFLAAYIDVPKEEILSYDLSLYPTEEGCLLGLHNELLSAPRLDNLTSSYGCLMGLIESKESDGIHVAILFDNEEVGNRTKQGAASTAIPHLLKQIYHYLGYTHENYLHALHSGFLLSVDVAHAVHPNLPEKHDPTHRPLLGKGPALKTACSQAYVGDAEALAIIRGLCQKYQIPYQYFVNRNDIPGGSTLGSALSTTLSIRGMDIGIPILSMHSAREVMSLEDQCLLQQLLIAFFSEP